MADEFFGQTIDLDGALQDKTSKLEFVALVAMMMAIVAFSVDSLLPAMPLIAKDFGLSDAQLAPLVLMTFLMGLGVATFFAGPLTDAYGRRPIACIGFAIYLYCY